MGRDYYGDVVGGSDGPLSEALTAALPGRFDHHKTIDPIDYPWGYTGRLLEAAVAAA